MKQREIKFRAWDKDKKIMVGDIDIDYTITMNGYIQELQKYYILLQYTGLKDKNGKEIYEGDIIKNPIVKDDKGTTINWDYNILLWVEQNCESFEVIGNIYKNPELLH